MEQTRIMLVDDHSVVRHGLKSLLSQCDDFIIVGESDGSADFVRSINTLNPDVILLDIRLNGIDGLDLSHRLKYSHPQIRILILTSYDDDVYFQKAIKAGVDGYILKSDSAEVLVEAIRSVRSGKTYLTGSMAGKAFKQLENINRTFVQYQSGLTDQEIELLKLVANGDSITEITQKLFMSERSVKRKIHGILEKLGVSNRAQAVAEAFRMGLL